MSGFQKSPKRNSAPLPNSYFKNLTSQVAHEITSLGIKSTRRLECGIKCWCLISNKRDQKKNRDKNILTGYANSKTNKYKCVSLVVTFLLTDLPFVTYFYASNYSFSKSSSFPRQGKPVVARNAWESHIKRSRNIRISVYSSDYFKKHSLWSHTWLKMAWAEWLHMLFNLSELVSSCIRCW